MTARGAARLAEGAWVASLLFAIAGFVVLGISFDVPRPLDAWGPRGFGMVVGMAFATVGTAIARRHPGNAVGWLYLVTGFLLSLLGLADEWAQHVLLGDGGDLPLGDWAAWVTNWMWVISVGTGLVYAVLLFPDGRYPTRAARRIGLLAAPLLVVVVAGQALGDFRIEGFGIQNPVTVLPISLDTASSLLGLMIAAVVAAQVVLIRRLRRSVGEERDQIRWVVLAEAFAAVALASNMIGVFGGPSWTIELAELLSIAGLLAIPVAAGVAILRRGLYGVETVISRSLVGAGLAAFVTAVYALVVGGAGALLQRGDRPNHLLGVVAAIVIALGVDPVRVRLRRFGDRVAFGSRAEPYEVLAGLSQRLQADQEPADVLRLLAQSLTEGTSATATTVWLRVRDELRPAASWPPDADVPDPVPVAGDSLAGVPGDRCEAIVHGGELLGAITLRTRHAEPLPVEADRLVRDLAGHAGLVLRNLRLTAELQERVDELRESRQRLVSAQDAERRRIERDLHDGAQQQLVAVKVRLSLARSAAEDAGNDEVADSLGEVAGQLTEAIEALRELAHGIYPPRLAADGLLRALRSRASMTPFELEVEGDVGRLTPEVEAAVYFCCLEAMQNTAKYASATCVRVDLALEDGWLRFTVADDGVGFDPEAVGRGAGTTNMRDRIDALGGRLDITSRPGSGAVVAGAVPAASPT
jgi:signal transduction histidine kinase